jgi:hypothetical protein
MFVNSGSVEGLSVGLPVGCFVGLADGIADGIADGLADGLADGACVFVLELVLVWMVASDPLSLSAAAADELTPVFSSRGKTTTQDTTTPITTATLIAASINRNESDHFLGDADVEVGSMFLLNLSVEAASLFFLESALACPFRRCRTAMNAVVGCGQ